MLRRCTGVSPKRSYLLPTAPFRSAISASAAQMLRYLVAPGIRPARMICATVQTRLQFRESKGRSNGLLVTANIGQIYSAANAAFDHLRVSHAPVVQATVTSKYLAYQHVIVLPASHPGPSISSSITRACLKPQLFRSVKKCLARARHFDQFTASLRFAAHVRSQVFWQRETLCRPRLQRISEQRHLLDDLSPYHAVIWTQSRSAVRGAR